MSTHKKYPFKFLDAYTSEDKDIFFGRNEEVDALYEMVFQSDLILIYGASGTGKSSLIQCGLASRFKSHDWLALNIRRGSNLNSSFERALQDAGGDSEAPGKDLDWLEEDLTGDSATPVIAQKLSPLAKSLKAIYLKHFKPIYLIFDQFEELYILGTKREQHAFVETIRQVLRVEQPVKVILSIREEYLGYLYEFERKVPELLRKKLRVEPMNLDKVKAVINGVNDFALSNVHLQKGEEAAIAETIFEKIKGDEKTLHIQLPYLQVFLDKLYLEISGDEDRIAEATISMDALQQMGDLGDVLRNFLDEQVLKTGRALKQKPETIWKILSPFVTLDGTKEPIDEAALCDRLPKIESGLIRNTLQAFVQSRILRYTENEQLYEIAHDALAKQIHAKRSDEEIALMEVQRLIKSQISLKEEAREFFTEKQLLFIQPFLDQYKLNAEEQNWMDKSEAHLQSQVAAEEAAKARKMAAARKRARVLAGFLAFSLLALVIAGYFGITANRTLADLKKKNADNAELILKNVDKDILNLRYEEALKKIKSADGLDALKPEVAKAYMEIAFWYGETGNTQRAIGILDSAATLLKNKHVLDLLSSLPSEPIAVRERLRDAMKALDSIHFDFLFGKKYYPEMVAVIGGTFDMGCDPTLDQACEDDETLHRQEVSSFKIAKYETSVWQYALYCAATKQDINNFLHPTWSDQGNKPLMYVLWYHGFEYANWLSMQFTELEKEQVYSGDLRSEEVKVDWSKKGFRLPTEAEWEYAAKGGDRPQGTIFSGSNTLDSVGYVDAYSLRTDSIGGGNANALGLYDMSGNVWEWCWDWYGEYPLNSERNYRGPQKGNQRVLRGGSWISKKASCRVSNRNYSLPGSQQKEGRINNSSGFRLAKSL